MEGMPNPLERDRGYESELPPCDAAGCKQKTGKVNKDCKQCDGSGHMKKK